MDKQLCHLSQFALTNIAIMPIGIEFKLLRVTINQSVIIKVTHIPIY